MNFAALLATVLAGVKIGACSPLGPTTYQVRPTHSLKLPTEAAAKLLSGDRVVIDPGEYTDCAVRRASHLTIEGAGPGW